MKQFKSYLKSIAVVGLSMLAVSALAADWPHWRGPQGDGISRETGMLKSWPEKGPQVLWEAKVDKGFSSFAVADGRVFTQFEDEAGQCVGAFDEKTGQPLWKKTTGEKYKGEGYPGPRSTPAVDGKRIYALDGTGNLFCLQAADGKEVWKKELLKETGGENLKWGLAGSPLIDGDVLYVAGGEAKGGAVLALNKKTGELIWKTLDDQAGYSTPVLAKLAGTRHLLMLTGTALVGLAPKDGKLLWSFPWKTKYDINAATPVVHEDKVFIAAGYEHGCALVQVLPGTPPTVKEVWQNKNLKARFSTPLLIDGYLYGFDEGDFACLDFATGEKKWSLSGYGWGSLAYADGVAFVQTEKGRLELGKLTPAKYEKISEVNGILGSRCWTVPVLANGRLYIRDEAKMLCLDVKAKK